MKTNRTSKITTLYWVTTILFALFMTASAIPDILSMDIAVKGMHEGLGYPLFFIPFIGVAKLLGSITVVMPRFYRLKEWAYAGLGFDLIGATYSMASIGAGAADLSFMIAPIALGTASYILSHKRFTKSTAVTFA